MSETVSHADVEDPPHLILDQNPSLERDPCVVCGATQAWICGLCSEDLFCDSCWDQQRPHRLQPRSNGAKMMRPHEKVTPAIYHRMVRIFNRDPDMGHGSGQDHDLEAAARWFGVRQETDTGYNFYTTGRFVEIAIDMSAGPDTLEQFPSFVSFVGETGMSPIVSLELSR